VLVIWLLTGKNPWENYPFVKAALMITEKTPFRLGKDFHCEGFLRDLTAYCMQKEPEKRPTTVTLMENQYFSKFSGNKHAGAIMHKILTFNDGNFRKIESMLQPLPLCGEDPDEMLDPECETE
jgi:serine/threonine protein kinase